MRWKDFYGQDRVKERILPLIDGDKMPHALILWGPEGIGKKMFARLLANELICENISGEGFCGECMNCEMVTAKTHPDYHEIKKEKESIGVDEIRSMIGHVQIKPFYAKRKVYLIPDDMTLQAQNALLKTLEEPPNYAIIIITTSNPGNLLDTIRSRALTIRFDKNTEEQLKEYICKNYPEKNRQLDFIIKYSDGIIGRVRRLLEDETLEEERSLALQILEDMVFGSKEAIFPLVKKIDERKSEWKNFLELLLIYARDALIIKYEGEKALLANIDKIERIKLITQSRQGKVWINVAGIVISTINALEQKANFQLAIEAMLLKLQEEI